MSSTNETLRDRMRAKGLRMTSQRMILAELLESADEHLDAEKVFQLARRRDSRIHRATVYRTLKLLVDAGLASIRHFGDGQARFEPREDEHHDHMICETCGHVFEFHDEEIERLQESLVKQKGFELVRHRHELYVKCLDPNCPRREDG